MKRDCTGLLQQDVHMKFTDGVWLAGMSITNHYLYKTYKRPVFIFNMFICSIY